MCVCTCVCECECVCVRVCVCTCVCALEANRGLSSEAAETITNRKGSLRFSHREHTLFAQPQHTQSSSLLYHTDTHTHTHTPTHTHTRPHTFMGLQPKPHRLTPETRTGSKDPTMLKKLTSCCSLRRHFINFNNPDLWLT